MSQVISFGNTILANSGKRGILKPMSDGSGYTRMNAGGFNIPNRGGIVYRFNDYLNECMSPDSDLNRRVSEGQVYCELGHPPQYYYERVNGLVVRTAITELFQWINRLRTIIMPNVCAHIRKIDWELTGGPKDPVHNSIELIPFGDHKAWTTDALANPDINFAVSLRSVTKPQKMGDMVREVEYLSTYDVVVEQGVLRACKHLSAGLESYLESAVLNTETSNEMTTTLDELIYVVDRGIREPGVMAAFEGTESFSRVQEMMTQLKKMKRTTPIRMISTNSLDVFR